MSSADRRRRVRHIFALAATLVLLTAATAFAQSYTVTTPADSGAGSLREAMTSANSDGVPSTIIFDPGVSGATISLASPLPSLSEDATEIDGDLDEDCAPDIAINGNWLPSANGFNLSSNSNRIAGLAIHSFDCPGCGGDLIVISGASGNLIECNYLGTDLTGTVPLGTSTFAIKLVQGADDNTMLNNLIAYNGPWVRRWPTST